MWFSSEGDYGMGKTINPISDNTGEWMTMPLVLTKVMYPVIMFYAWALHVTGDSNEYIEAVDEFTEGAKNRGLEMGSYGLSAVVAGC